jgi:Arc/MetJ-type ribon-helix-helix transcriptional regulator
MTNVIQSSAVERALSVRLDVQAQRALEILMRNGQSQSEAVRAALLESARRRVYVIAAEDAARLAADPRDRKEMADIAAFFDALDEEG